MARRPRDTRHRMQHLTNRGGRRRDIFLDDIDHEEFLRLVALLVITFGVRVRAYCLMSNHYHLILEFPEGNMADAMRFLGSRYVQYFNERHGFDGPLFRGRYHNVPISSDAQFEQTVRYVHDNPRKPFPHIRPRDYPWSSLGIVMGDRPAPDWFGAAPTISGGVRNHTDIDAPSRVRNPTDIDAPSGVRNPTRTNHQSGRGS